MSLLSKPTRQPPILASIGKYLPPLVDARIDRAAIGTVLIDIFDTLSGSQPARPELSCPTSNGSPSASSSHPLPSLLAPDPLHSGSHIPQLAFPSQPSSSNTPREVVGGGALYTLIGARLWLPPSELCTLIDRAFGEVPELDIELNAFGREMWMWNEGEGRRMTRARICYDGDKRLHVFPLSPGDPADENGSSAISRW